MKKILISLVFCIIWNSVFSQDSTYYYFNGIRETLYKITNYLIIDGLEQNINHLDACIEFKDILSVDSNRVLINHNDEIYSTKLFFNQPLSINEYQDVLDTIRIRYNIKTRECYCTKSYTESTASNYFYVKLRDSSDANLLQSYAGYYSCNIVDNDPFMSLWYTLENNNDTLNSIELANIFFESNFFDKSEPDLLSANYLSSYNHLLDSCNSDQWGLFGANNINVKNAWDLTTGNGIIVSVIDNGIELTHPDLYHNILTLSYDAKQRTNQTSIYGNTASHTYSHGTNCAGIISAENNGYGVIGIAYDSKLLSVCSPSDFVSLQIRALADGICWSYLNGADVINCSWYSNKSDYIRDAINSATTLGRDGLGSIVVVAAGNQEGKIHFPAICENTIAVGAIDERATRVSVSWQSCYGEELDIVAPGINIPTTDITGTLGLNNGIFTSEYSDVDYTNRFDGTSAACPHVSGVAVLILSANPNLTMPQVREIISRSARKIEEDTYMYRENDGIHNYGSWNEEVGYGLVDAYKSVVKAKYYDCYNYEPFIFSNDINVTTTVNEDAFGYGDIIIKTGVIVTLQSTLFLAPNTRIIIEPGAELIIDGGVITSACSGFWEGIYVVGDKSLPQTMTNQGSIIMSNGAVIENARCAIHTWAENDYNTTGGIIQATNSTFKNNIRGIEFLSYMNHITSLPDIEIDNVSYLRNCTFTWDDDMFAANSENYTHVSMWDMKGIKIQGCTFKDERSIKDKITTGINTISSVFSVNAAMVGTSIYNLIEQNSKFENMIYGIRVGNTSDNLPFTITKSEFKNNYTGVYATNADSLSITNTYFNVGVNNFANATYSNSALGLVVESSRGFEIKNNNFQSSTNTQTTGTVGLQVKGSGPQSNLVNNNVFNKLHYGTQTINNNIGLKYMCNNFTNCQYGISALLSSSALGIQGCLRSAATNTFSNNMTDLYADFVATYTYYYPSTSGVPSHNTNVITRSAIPSPSSCGTIGVVHLEDIPITPIFPNLMSLTSVFNGVDVDELYILLVAEYGNLYNVPENLLRALADHETKEGLKAKEILFFKGLELSYHPIVIEVADEMVEVENKMITITENIADRYISITPNPAKDEITIVAEGLVEILNEKGQIVKEYTISGKQIINISDIELGIYYIKSNNKIEKLIKQ